MAAEIRGIIPPILTPMHEDESINEQELRRQVDRVIDGGVHGACRSAGNAAAQATLSGLLCAEAVAKVVRSGALPEAKAEYRVDETVRECFLPQAQALAVKALGIYRRGEALEDAKEKLEALLADPALAQDDKTRQAVESMTLMVRAALRRRESRGTHMRLDYPEQDAAQAHGMEI